MWTPTLALLALIVFFACASLGGGLYEFLVVDPAWPRPDHRPTQAGRHQPQAVLDTGSHGVRGVADRRSGDDLEPARRAHPLLVVLGSHLVMRFWSLVDFIPKALAFESADPATIDAAAATRWTQRSLLRMPLDALSCGAALAALVAGV